MFANKEEPKKGDYTPPTYWVRKEIWGGRDRLAPLTKKEAISPRKKKD